MKTDRRGTSYSRPVPIVKDIFETEGRHLTKPSLCSLDYAFCWTNRPDSDLHNHALQVRGPPAGAFPNCLPAPGDLLRNFPRVILRSFAVLIQRPRSIVTSRQTLGRGFVHPDVKEFRENRDRVSPKHDLTLATMSEESIALVVDLWAAQEVEIGATANIQYV